MLKIVKSKPSKLIVDRKDLEDLLNSVVMYLEANGNCWDEELGSQDTDQAFNLAQALRRVAEDIDVDLGGVKEFDY